MKTIKSYHKHIDNGGIGVSINEEHAYKGDDGDDFYNYFINLTASYFGYPSVESNLMIHSVDDLKEIGLMFLAAHQKITGK